MLLPRLRKLKQEQREIDLPKGFIRPVPNILSNHLVDKQAQVYGISLKVNYDADVSRLVCTDPDGGLYDVPGPLGLLNDVYNARLVALTHNLEPRELWLTPDDYYELLKDSGSRHLLTF